MTSSLTLVNLLEAQRAFVAKQNESLRYSDMTPESDYWNIIGPSIEDHVETTIERYARGERVECDDVQDAPVEDRLLRLVSGQNHMFGNAQRIGLGLVFPRLLEEAAAKLSHGHLSVSVSTFYNCREAGLVYTIMEPSGKLQSFSVYEHRNSDSIIINGCEDWDGESLPYAADSKNAFYAEIPCGEYSQAADALLFFLREAARGELASSAELVAKAEHLDWNAILSKQIPGFAEWVERHGGKPMDRFESADSE